MEITEAQYERIKDALPVQRGNVRLSNLQVLNAVLYVAEQGCKWRGLPKRYEPLAHDLHADESLVQERRSRSGIREVAVGADRADQDIEAFALDSTSIKVHPDGTGALLEPDLKPSASRAADGTPRFIWLPRMLERP